MTNYLKAFHDALKSGSITEELIRKHVERHALIDEMLPEAASFYYVVELLAKKYHFLGRQQVAVSGYSNEEFLEKGVELFLECVHPEDVEVILNSVYPELSSILLTVPVEEVQRLQFQYNYRFRRKDGKYLNLFEQIYVLEMDDAGVPSLFLGNVIVLNNKETLPVRFACKRIGDFGVSETVCFKSFNRYEVSLDTVTARELDILRNLAAGMTSREIAEQFHISKHTVDTHRRSLLKKLNCKSVVELAQIAFANGLL